MSRSIALLCLLVASPLTAQEPAWKAEARRWGLDEVEIAQLEREGLVVGRESYASPIEAYRPREVPYFVTSEVVLYAFGRVLEDCMVPAESANAQRLKRSLAMDWQELHSPKRFEGLSDPLLIAAIPRVRRIVAVARLLLGEELELLPEDREPVLELVAAIQRGAGRAQPAWMGPFDAGFAFIDLERFRPVGIYAGDDELEKFFRASRWLQMVPFRVRREDEMAALWHLDQMAPWPSPSQGRMQELLCGSANDWDPRLIGEIDPPFGLAQFRAHIEARRATWPRKLTLDLPHTTEAKLADEEGFRWLPSATPPDSRLLHALGHFDDGPENRAIEGRGRASMIDIGAALGSPIAREALGAERARFVAQCSADLFTAQSLYGSTLATLALLLDAPEPEAPALFRSEAWRRKSLASALGGWIETRSVFVRTIVGAYGRGGAADHVGFVEPDPRFFEALADHCASLAKLPIKSSSENLSSATERARRLAALLWRLEGLADQQLRGRDLSVADREFYDALDLELAELTQGGRHHGETRATEVMRVLDTADFSIVAGTGRPRALWLLYPWKGELVLCRGAVLPVYEVDTPHTLTHAEWDRRVSEGRDLELPTWLKPIYAHGR